MNDERFFDLTMKVIARQTTDAERAELDALLAHEPDLRAEFERLQTDARVAKDALPLLDATQATAGELPAYARGRLQTKVKQTLGTHRSLQETERKSAWRWQWILGLPTATALILFLLIPNFTQSGKMTVRVAMLDTAGTTRSANANEMTILQKFGTGAAVESFSQSDELAAWENNWPGKEKQPAAKIIYDRAAGEARVLGRWKGRPFQRTFLVERDLETTLRDAETFIREQTGGIKRGN